MLIFAVFCHCYRNFIPTLFNSYGGLMSITETISATPTHLSIQREEVLRIIEQEDFPCVFSRKAASTHKLFWLFLDSKENSQGCIGSKLVLVINPREVFDVVAPQNKLKGLKIRQKIRARIKKYNSDAPIPTQLGFFGDPNNKEWQQYQLIEPGSLVLNTCPLHMKKEQK
jgi:FPC/CPF motif-containing protein YcgG